MTRVRKPVVKRLEANTRVDENGCWIWQGNVGNHGYGRINIEGQIRLAHRVCYELLRGTIAPQLVVDHLCRVRICVNPEHLEPITDAENIRRGLQGELKTHCFKGHPWIPENIVSNGLTQAGNIARTCAICRRERKREQALRRRLSGQRA